MDPITTAAGLDAFIAQLGNGQGDAPATPPATPPAATPPPSTTPPATTPPAAGTPATPPATPPAEDPPFEPDVLFNADKKNAAFAQMRVQTKAMEQTLLRVAQTLGIDTKDPEVLIQALNRRLNEHQAETTGVPLDMLEKMERLTSDAEKQQSETRAAEATRGFQRVKDEFKLTNKDLSDFAVQLQTAGKNPFAEPMDLVREYQLLNYDKLMAKAKDDAIAAAAKLQQHGEQHSTQPGTAAPAATPGSAKPVNSVAALEAFMKDFQ